LLGELRTEIRIMGVTHASVCVCGVGRRTLSVHYCIIIVVVAVKLNRVKSSITLLLPRVLRTVDSTTPTHMRRTKHKDLLSHLYHTIRLLGGRFLRSRALAGIDSCIMDFQVSETTTKRTKGPPIKPSCDRENAMVKLHLNR